MTIYPTGPKIGSGLEFGHEFSGEYRFGGHIITDGLLAWWKHDEGAGATLNDYYGGYNGTINGAGFWANNGPDGNPVGTYDGSTNYCRIADETALQCSSGVTIVAAIYLDNVVDANSRCCIGKTDDDPLTVGNYKLIRIASATDMRFAYSEDDEKWHSFDTSDFALAASTWYIATVSFTYGTGSSMEIYRNLNKCAGSWTTRSGSGSPATTGYPSLGRDDKLGGDQYWDGRLGDILLYDRALSLAEITTNYNALKHRYNL